MMAEAGTEFFLIIIKLSLICISSCDIQTSRKRECHEYPSNNFLFPLFHNSRKGFLSQQCIEKLTTPEKRGR
jgi:hypothetical protein